MVKKCVEILDLHIEECKKEIENSIGTDFNYYYAMRLTLEWLKLIRKELWEHG